MTEWISVEDRLPEECQEVLYMPRRPKYPTVIFMDGEFGIDGRTFAVRHWMPLPEPPDLVTGGVQDRHKCTLYHAFAG